MSSSADIETTKEKQADSKIIEEEEEPATKLLEFEVLQPEDETER